MYVLVKIKKIYHSFIIFHFLITILKRHVLYFFHFYMYIKGCNKQKGIRPPSKKDNLIPSNYMN